MPRIVPVLLALCLLVAASPASGGVVLGPEVEVDRMAVRPPAGFWPLQVVGDDTGALAPGWPGAGRRLLLAMIRDPDVVFAVSRIDARFEEGAMARDRLVRHVLDQQRDTLDLDAGLLWAERGHAGGLRLALRFTLAGEKREMLLGFVPLGERTVAVALAGPAEAMQGLEPTFDGVLRSVEARESPAEQRRRASHGVAAALALIAGGGLAALQQRRATPPSKQVR